MNRILVIINENDPGQLHGSTVAYINEGFELYFATSVKSCKLSNPGF